MLSDREQACDQEVCILGGQSAVYAASLLKVLRFCIDFRMAGVSGAAGSNLKRRIEEIMGNEVNKRSAPRQRAFVVTVALAVMVFSVAAGVMSRDRFFAEQASNKQEGIKGGVQGRVTGEKVGEYANPHILPYDLAPLAVAICRLFRNPHGEGAKMAWEQQGPGQIFGKRESP